MHSKSANRGSPDGMKKPGSACCCPACNAGMNAHFTMLQSSLQYRERMVMLPCWCRPACNAGMNGHFTMLQSSLQCRERMVMLPCCCPACSAGSEWSFYHAGAQPRVQGANGHVTMLVPSLECRERMVILPCCCPGAGQ
ncbi:hypothetical protein ACOMHN_042041 [Nucella lapillus]